MLIRLMRDSRERVRLTSIMQMNVTRSLVVGVLEKIFGTSGLLSIAHHGACTVEGWIGSIPQVCGLEGFPAPP